ncbi:MAG TPA: hypothetical protein VFA86_13795 [Gammaproteobacteria bacterium]|nr:hypothetical protein [Gammaproteobacteria bacterium]
MALINCVECSHQVSDQAASCPNCGAPTATGRRAAMPVEQTAKRFKAQTVLAVMAIIAGFIFTTAAAGSGSIAFVVATSVLTLGGIVWFVVIRVRTWWHHG